jgi:hypothetical protein
MNSDIEGPKGKISRPSSGLPEMPMASILSNF